MFLLLPTVHAAAARTHAQLGTEVVVRKQAGLAERLVHLLTIRDNVLARQACVCTLLHIGRKCIPWSPRPRNNSPIVWIQVCQIFQLSKVNNG